MHNIFSLSIFEARSSKRSNSFIQIDIFWVPTEIFFVIKKKTVWFHNYLILSTLQAPTTTTSIAFPSAALLALLTALATAWTWNEENYCHAMFSWVSVQLWWANTMQHTRKKETKWKKKKKKKKRRITRFELTSSNPIVEIDANAVFQVEPMYNAIELWCLNNFFATKNWTHTQT